MYQRTGVGGLQRPLLPRAQACIRYAPNITVDLPENVLHASRHICHHQAGMFAQ